MSISSFITKDYWHTLLLFWRIQSEITNLLLFPIWLGSSTILNVTKWCDNWFKISAENVLAEYYSSLNIRCIWRYDHSSFLYHLETFTKSRHPLRKFIIRTIFLFIESWFSYCTKRKSSSNEDKMNRGMNRYKWWLLKKLERNSFKLINPRLSQSAFVDLNIHFQPNYTSLGIDEFSIKINLR